MGVFTADRQKKADRYNAARQASVERFLSQTYYKGKAEQDLLTRVSTETAEDYAIRQEGYLKVIEPMREETGAWRDDYYQSYDRSGKPINLVMAKLLDREYEFLEICEWILKENCLRAEDASYYANRLGRLLYRRKQAFMAELARKHGLPDEVKRFIKKF